MSKRTYKKKEYDMGGAPYHATEKAKAEIVALKSFGITNEDIAKYLNISTDTLTRHYRYELDIAHVRATAQVAGKLFKKAVEDGDITAIIFWLKTRARWRTEDHKQAQESNEDVIREMKELRANLDKQNRKDY